MNPKNLHDTNFFYRENEEAKTKVISALNRITPEILRCCRDVISIILFGSFARGEGVWKGKKNLGIISDLDLLIVTKRKKAASEKLKRMIKQVEEKEKIAVELDFVCHKSLKKLRKDTHNLDRKEGIVIWGEDVTSNFPQFRKEEINIKDIIFLFFNRILLALEKFPVKDVKNIKSKTWLSHEACKGIFTCTDMICIRYSNYNPAVIKRIEFARKKCKQLMITNKDVFLEDLERAFNFRFRDVSTFYMNDAYDYWLRSRDHLLNLFQLCIRENHEKTSPVDEEKFKSQLRRLYKLGYNQGFILPFLRKIRFQLYQLYNLLRLKKKPKLPKALGQYDLSCRMASLMLYMAINKQDLVENYLTKAENYLSMVYHFPKTKEKNLIYTWALLRSELRKLHKAGICP